MDSNFTGFTGRLGADVQYSEGRNGSAARATGRLIVNRRFAKEGTERRYDAIPFVAWGAHAETLRRFGHKGKEIYIQGELHTNAEQGADGKWKNYFEVSIDYISLGRDSNTVKAQKAVEAAGGPETDAGKILTALKDPEFQRRLHSMVQNQEKAQGIAPAGQLLVELPQRQEEVAPRMLHHEEPPAEIYESDSPFDG